MNLLLDTNIVLNILRAKNIEAVKAFINPENSGLYLSIVSEGELQSLSIRNKWGQNRISLLNYQLLRN
jgi:tRNA(fMet)-specific endonuclease VapC